MKYEKFDLIVFSEIYDHFEVDQKKTINSLIFLFKHYLTEKGILNLLTLKKKNSETIYNSLKKIRRFKKNIRLKQLVDEDFDNIIIAKKKVRNVKGEN